MEESDDLQKFLASQEQSEIPLIEVLPTFLEEGVATAPAHKCKLGTLGKQFMT